MDMDANGKPIGLATTITTIDSGSGILNIVLRHEPNKDGTGVLSGDITNAVRLAEKNIKSIENNSRSGKTTKYSYDAYNALCISLTAQKNYERALIACNTAIKDSPNRWFAFNSRGSLKYQTEKFKDAISDYRLALDNAPKFADITSILEHNIRLSEAKVTK